MDNSSGAGVASGPLGEQIAAEYLQAAGYSVVCRNYRTRFGEIDIVAENSRFLVCAEVKTRKEDALAGPLESVTPAKRRRLVKTALLYLQSFPTALQPRFDVIGVTLKRARPAVQHIENAFDGGGFF